MIRERENGPCVGPELIKTFYHCRRFVVAFSFHVTRSKVVRPATAFIIRGQVIGIIIVLNPPPPFRRNETVRRARHWPRARLCEKPIKMDACRVC